MNGVATFGRAFHVGMVTADVCTTSSAITSAFGTRWVALPRPDVVHDTPRGPVRPSCAVSYSMGDSAPYVELLQAGRGTIYEHRAEPYLHHIGYWVDDVRQSVEIARTEGWLLEATMSDASGHPSTFAYMSRPDEVWIELVDVANRPLLERLLSGATPAPTSSSGWFGRTPETSAT